MKKTAMTLAVALLFVTSFACSNWNKVTPKALDNTAIESEIRKNLTADGITGLSINVDSGSGRVTLSGSVKTSSDRQKAYDDAAKVPGVSSVVNNVTVGQ